MMSEKRFKLSKYVTPSSTSYFFDENGKMLNKEVVKVLNKQQATINRVEAENDDLRTTITKQVEAITEMKDIIYMLEDLRIGDYSSEIEEDMQELKKAYDGTLEDFLNYFKD